MNLKTLWTVFIAANAALIKGTMLRLSGSDDYGLIGQIYTFHCKIDGELRETVQFKKDGTPICVVRVQSCTTNGSPGYNCGCDSSGLFMYLKIQKVDAEDEAIWSCYSSSPSNEVNLAVYGDLHAVVLSTYSLKPANEGGDLESVICSASCRPACSYVWYKNNTANIIPSSNGVLTLRDLNRTASGRYFCIATHTILNTSMISPKLDLNVYYGPDAVSYNKTTSIGVSEGEAVAPISCKAECNPNCSISWYMYKQPNTVISNNNILHLINTNRSQSGSYYCQAFNNETKQQRNSKPIDIDIYYGPDAVTMNRTSSIGITEGEAVGPISCKAECNPKCSISWYKKSNTVVSDNNILHLINTNRSQSGRYYCQAFNNVTKQRIRSNPIDINVYFGPDSMSLNQTTSIGITEGEAVGPISCKADCNPNCSISWYKHMEGDKQPNAVVSNNNILHLINTNRSQSGSYYCQAFNKVTKQQRNSKPIDIDIYYGPDADGMSLNQTTSIGVTEGEAVGPISCKAECNPNCSISWYKQPNTIISNNSILHLINTNRSQSGSYYCQAFNKVTKQRRNSNPIHIDIYYGLDDISLNQTTAIGVTEGESVGPVSCKAECNPKCFFFWYKQSNTVISNNSILHLINTNRSQSGSYYCQAFNNVTKQRRNSKPIDIDIYFGPEAVSLNRTTSIGVTEGEAVGPVFCKAECNPNCSISWYKQPNTFISNNSILHLINTNRSQSGSYYCQAFNNETKQQRNSNPIDIDIYYGPDADGMSLNQTTSIGVTEGEAVGPISCEAECNPNCSISWYKQPNTIISNNNILHLINTNRSQSGNYYCQAFNNVTKQRSSSNPIDIDVYFPPEMMTSWTLYEEIDRDTTNVTMNCEATSNPPANVSWFTDIGGKSIGQGNQYAVDISCEDQRNYFCVADNGVGSPVSNTFSLNITCFASSPSTAQTPEVILNSTVQTTTSSSTVATTGPILAPENSTLVYVLTGIIVILVILIIVYCCIRNKEKVKVICRLLSVLCYRRNVHHDTGAQNTETGTENAGFNNDIQRRTESNALVSINNGQSSNGSVESPEAYNRASSGSSQTIPKYFVLEEQSPCNAPNAVMPVRRELPKVDESEDSGSSAKPYKSAKMISAKINFYNMPNSGQDSDSSSEAQNDTNNLADVRHNPDNITEGAHDRGNNCNTTC